MLVRTTIKKVANYKVIKSIATYFYRFWKFNILIQTEKIRAKKTPKATKIAAVGPMKLRSYPK